MPARSPSPQSSGTLREISEPDERNDGFLNATTGDHPIGVNADPVHERAAAPGARRPGKLLGINCLDLGAGLTLNTVVMLPRHDLVGHQRGQISKAGRSEIRHAAAQYDGTATIRDADIVRDAICNGIG